VSIRSSKPVVCDLFAGFGGLSLGLAAAGLDTRWAVEWDKNAAATYADCHPETEVFNESVEVFLERVRSGERRSPSPDEVDLLVGGPPCQGFSGNNRYRKSEDPRNNMVPLFLDAVELLQPRWTLMENVTGILSMDDGKVVRDSIVRLESLGYLTRVVILQAGNYRTAQDRWRVFIFGARNGLAVPEAPVPRTSFPRTNLFHAKDWINCVVKGPHPGSGNLFERELPNFTVADAISDIPCEVSSSADVPVLYAGEPAGGFQQIMRRGTEGMFDHVGERLGPVQAARAAAVPKRPGAGWLDLPEELKPRNLLRYGGRSHNNRFGRLWWEGYFATMVTMPYMYWGRYIHPEADRTLTIRECARAQGIPDRVRFRGAMGARFRQVGNAVPPPLAKCIGLEFMRAMGLPAEDDGTPL
jgi:DNA (cytosine-5)-methyltransferase 1